MALRPLADASAQNRNVGDNYIADELGRLADLLDRGVLTQTEFERQKAKLLAE
jgi:hypothetical protein